MKTNFLTLSLLVLNSAHALLPAPSYIKSDILETSRGVNKFLQAEALDYSVCLNEMKETFNFLRTADKSFFKTNYTADQNKEILLNLWDIKKGIRKHSNNWIKSNQMGPECVSQIKASLRATRYIEDSIGLLYNNQINEEKTTGLKKEDHTPLFSKGLPWTVSDGKFDYKKDLRTGDILMWRGNSAVSASIARLGDNENNFSHLSILYIHPETGKRYNIEALIETGLIAREFDKVVVKKGASKVVVYRHANQELAQKAAKFAYDKAMERTDDHFIGYDFKFDLDDHSTLFCSELVSWSYDEASNGTIKVPTFNTTIDLENRSYVDAIGMIGDIAFQPGDIELEADLEMIAEWRNYHQVRTNQLMDNILSNMYNWMESKNYHFNFNLHGSIIGSGVYLFRKVPVLGERLLGGKIPDNMPASTLRSIMTLDKTSSYIFENVYETLYGESKAKIYSFQEVENTIEKLRKKDLDNYKKSLGRLRFLYKNSVIFHHMFSPKK